MNELSGKHVVIVLGVREGRGFDFLEQPLFIEASLKGHCIESDPVQPSAYPTVCTELVWETEKKEVRKLRSSHVPLRINCYTLDSTSQRVKIGFVLLSLRSAAAISGEVASSIEAQWHRLVNVPSCWRVHRPELALTLTVRDRICSPRDSMTTSKSTSGECIAITDPQATTVIPIIYLENGFIQIGQNSPKNQKFLLSFLIGTANNLDLLLNENMVFNSTGEKFYLSLTILGLSINTKYITKNLHEPIILNEKIVFKLLTNTEILKLFLEEFKVVPLCFHHGLKIIATAEISLNYFTDPEKFVIGVPRKYAQVSEFHPKEFDLVQVDNRIPNITTETVLETLGLSYMSAESSFEPSQVSSMETVPEETLNACGDQIRDSGKIEEIKSTLKMEDAAVQTTPRELTIAKSSLTHLRNTPSAKRSLSDALNSEEAINYRLFNLTITFRSITWRKNLNIEGFQFKFQHPKVNQALIINCDLAELSPNEIIILEDVSCILHFLSTQDNVKNLISMYAPTISLQNYEDKNIVDDFMLYTKLLLESTDDVCDYFAVLNAVDDKNDLLCDLQIELKINELSQGFTMKHDESVFNLDPIILDDWLALKTVKDLEEWKEKQEILFNDNLKRSECEKLEQLQAEWNIKRIELETKLQQGMEKCKVLSEELVATANQLRLKQRSLDEKLLQSPESRENIEIKVTQMLEEEMNKNVERIEAEKEKLMEKIEQLTQEKLNLEEQIRMKETELEEMRKTTLTKEQTARLLQELRHMEEQFQQAQMEKAFFKQQWHNALQEVHALKSEDQRQIQQDIRKKKEELSQLSLDAENDANSDDRAYEHDQQVQTYLY